VVGDDALDQFEGKLPANLRNLFRFYRQDFDRHWTLDELARELNRSKRTVQRLKDQLAERFLNAFPKEARAVRHLRRS
jgi:transcriptional regulator GlxA family with amidase domain